MAYPKFKYRHKYPNFWKSLKKPDGKPRFTILCTGGRHFGHAISSIDPLYEEKNNERMHVENALDLYYNHIEQLVPASLPIEFIAGGAKGVDTIVRRWCEDYVPRILFREFPADWNLFGAAAGPIRNKQMLGELPNMVLAFPGGKGTKNMIDIARKQHFPVIKYFVDGDLEEIIKEL